MPNIRVAADSSGWLVAPNSRPRAGRGLQGEGAQKAKGKDLVLCPLLPLDPGLSDQTQFPCSFIHSCGKYLLSSYSVLSKY